MSMFVPSCRKFNYLLRKNQPVMLRNAEKKSEMKKTAAPICFPFLLDCLGSREVLGLTEFRDLV